MMFVQHHTSWHASLFVIQRNFNKARSHMFQTTIWTTKPPLLTADYIRTYQIRDVVVAVLNAIFTFTFTLFYSP